ncbi:sirohydrochlorin chelatase [Bacillus sp. B15-48]|uniref:sirohydrochlorin chelatase n=1 Tax=Bacillus sp. B15-48 TaxID=1548601 RepID=UPI00193F30C2|nr:sirohydrochlorin chelatase [Bacillus sp. B15-48]MBM4762827.1 sirohydrochlorin chelatase [Bacillus sp. B15-48]
MKAILYIAHGTRSKIGVQEVKSFIQKVKERLHVPIQELSFLELSEPSIEDGFQHCVERGATEITIVPLFLLAAGHIKKDIPEILYSIKKNYPDTEIIVKDPFGVEEEILNAIAEVVSETVGEVKKDDSVLIVGRGSSDPTVHEAFSQISEGVKNRLGIDNISVGYLAATEPKFDQALETISEVAGNRIIVIPYLLFSGILLSAINQKVSKRQKQGQLIVQTGPLGEHSAIENIVFQRAIDEGGAYVSIDD